MQIRREAHTINGGYLPEHTTKESSGCCFFLCLPIKPECLFESLNQAIRLNRGATCWNSVLHDIQKIRLGDLQAAWRKSVRLLLSRGTKIIHRKMNVSQKGQSRDLLPRKLNRIDKRETKAPNNGGDYIISLLVSSILACPEKVNTRKKTTELEAVVKMKSFCRMSSLAGQLFFLSKNENQTFCLEIGQKLKLWPCLSLVCLFFKSKRRKKILHFPTNSTVVSRSNSYLE